MAVGPKYLKYGILLRVLRERLPELPVGMSNLGEGLTVLESDVCEVLCAKGGRVSWGSMGDSCFRAGAFLPSLGASAVALLSSP